MKPAKTIRLGLLAIFAIMIAIGASLPGCSCVETGSESGGKKMMVIAFDGLDPILITKWMNQGYLPNFLKLKNQGGFTPLGTSVPPQSPVAWSNFITGMNPGGHGIFDFIHRNPENYQPEFSTSKAISPTKFYNIPGYRIPRDGETKNLRKGKAFWQYLGDKGIPATIFSIPSNYPPVEGPFRSISGMGTPDLLGGYGTFFYYTETPHPKKDVTGGKVINVRVNNGVVEGRIPGPKNDLKKLEKGQRAKPVEIPFQAYIDPETEVVRIDIQDSRIILKKDEWSQWQQIEFEMVPMLVSVKGMVRFLLKSAKPFQLYVSPINIDPRDPAQPISTPPEYAAELAEARGGRPFHTQGIPEDTKGLSNDVLSNADFVSQAQTVLDERLELFDYELSQFEDGFLFFYFSSSDQVGHMFWRTMDQVHPAYDPARDSEYESTLRDFYVQLDAALGKAIEKAGDDTLLMVMSDHGFAPFYRSFHLSTWLLENDYVTLMNPSDRETGYLLNVEWMTTKAYTLGINGLYLNLKGREAEGIISPTEADALLDEIITKLEAVTDPETGHRVIHKVYKASEVYQGPDSDKAPDLIVGYARGYRGSWETALGKFPEGDLIALNEDEWSGDHCMAAELVPGSLFVNRPFKLHDPKLYDLPLTILEEFGIERPRNMIGRNLFTGK